MKDSKKIIWLEYAEDDLNEIYNYILADSLYYASKTVIGIVNKIDSNTIYIHRIFHSSRLFTDSILKIKSN